MAAEVRVVFPAPLGPHIRMWGISLSAGGFTGDAERWKHIWCPLVDVSNCFIWFLASYINLSSTFGNTQCAGQDITEYPEPTACHATKSLAEILVVVQLAANFRCKLSLYNIYILYIYIIYIYRSFTFESTVQPLLTTSGIILWVLPACARVFGRCLSTQSMAFQVRGVMQCHQEKTTATHGQYPVGSWLLRAFSDFLWV